MEKSDLKKIISVFKTDIQEQDLNKLIPALNGFDKIIRWNTDLEDCDNILRIESYDIVTDEVINMLSKIGFRAEELED